MQLLITYYEALASLAAQQRSRPELLGAFLDVRPIESHKSLLLQWQRIGLTAGIIRNATETARASLRSAIRALRWTNEHLVCLVEDGRFLEMAPLRLDVIKEFRVSRDAIAVARITVRGRVATVPGGWTCVSLDDTNNDVVSSVLRLPIESGVTALALSDDGTVLAVASSGRSVRLLDTGHNETIREWSGLATRATVLDLAADGGTLYVGLGDGVTKCWNRDGVELWSRPEHHGAPSAMASSPDGRFLAVGDSGYVRLRRSDTGEQIHVIDVGIGSVKSLVYSPDGRRLAVACDDSTVRVVDTVNGNSVTALSGHAQSVLAVAWSPDSGQLISGDALGRIIVWEIRRPD